MHVDTMYEVNETLYKCITDSQYGMHQRVSARMTKRALPPQSLRIHNIELCAKNKQDELLAMIASVVSNHSLRRVEPPNKHGQIVRQ